MDGTTRLGHDRLGSRIVPALVTALRNPVTNEPHAVAIVLEHGFIWERGECGQGDFRVSAEGIDLRFDDTNWILYDFDWTNQE